MEETSNEAGHRLSWRDLSRNPLMTAVLTPMLLFIGGILTFAAFAMRAEELKSGASASPSASVIPAVLVLAAGVAAGVRTWVLFRRAQQHRLAALRADSLPERAQRTAEVLQEATTLVEELQAELTARTALLEDVQRQVAAGSRRVEDIEKLSHIDDETTRAFNNALDQALERRLAAVERGSRQREWFIGTVVAVVVGVVAILLAHFALGF